LGGELKKLCVSAIRFVFLVSSMSAQDTFGFGSLDEFLSSNGNTLRTSTVFTTDIVAKPRWAVPSSIPMVLCTGGTSYAEAPVNIITDKTTELLEDINNAASAWTDINGGPEFAAATEDSSCGPNQGSTGGGQNSVNEILFTDQLPPGVLGLTNLYYSVSDGVLTLIETDIEMSTNYDSNLGSNERWVTSDCFDCGGACPDTCTAGSFQLSFEGVLLHELGHALGLSHTTVTDDNDTDGIDTTPTMFPSVSSLMSSQEMESLQTDDSLSKQNLYSAAGFPNYTTHGRISGTVSDTSGNPVRGAHVYAFSTVSETTIAGTFSGSTGTYSSTSGVWQIDGIPFNEDFIVVVEPVHRPEVSESLIYPVYNAPIFYALNSNFLGLRDFAVEAYPDVSITDIRLYSSILAAPGIDDAEVFQLSVVNPQLADINFYISDAITAPNDNESLTATYPSNTKISNSNPLVITVTSDVGLNILSNPTVSLTAVRSATTSDWSAGLSSVTWTGNEVEIEVNPTLIDVSNGPYNLNFEITDSKYGTYSSVKNITVNGWSRTILGGTSSSGGGCLITQRKTNFVFWILIAALFALATALLRNRSIGNRLLLWPRSDRA
jgi:hypothetical protein